MLPAKVESFAPSACHSTTPFCLSFHQQVESEDRTQCCLHKIESLAPSACQSTIAVLLVIPPAGGIRGPHTMLFAES
jgi:hypothetical protein